MGLHFLVLPVSTAYGQESEGITAEAAVRRAVELHPSVAAARHRLEAATAGVRSARAPYNPLAELAPGVGFTNGNALLSQQFDIGGRLSAQGRAAEGQRLAVAAELELARLRAAAEARTAYFDLARAVAVQSAAEEAATLARQIRDLVQRRVEIGEAPQVQATRAAIEVARAEQEVVRARGDVQSRQAGLNVLLGQPPETPVSLRDGLTLPDEPSSAAETLQQAQRQRPELAVVRGLIAARQGEVSVAGAQRRPELYAEFATDTWSLNRDPFRTRNLGLQARLSFPLFDRGRIRSAVDQARAGVRERQAELEAATRTLTVEVERAVAELRAAREIALNYQRSILPQSEELLTATRKGFEAGLSSFLEVLEAQRLVRQTRVEYQTALYEAVRTQAALERATGAVPGLTLAPQPLPRTSRP